MAGSNTSPYANTGPGDWITAGLDTVFAPNPLYQTLAGVPVTASSMAPTNMVYYVDSQYIGLPSTTTWAPIAQPVDQAAQQEAVRRLYESLMQMQQMGPRPHVHTFTVHAVEESEAIVRLRKRCGCGEVAWDRIVALDNAPLMVQGGRAIDDE